MTRVRLGNTALAGCVLAVALVEQTIAALPELRRYDWTDRAPATSEPNPFHSRPASGRIPHVLSSAACLVLVALLWATVIVAALESYGG